MAFAAVFGMATIFTGCGDDDDDDDNGGGGAQQNLAPATFANLSQNRTFMVTSGAGNETLTFPTTSSFMLTGTDGGEPYTITGQIEGNPIRSADGNS